MSVNLRWGALCAVLVAGVLPVSPAVAAPGDTWICQGASGVLYSPTSTQRTPFGAIANPVRSPCVTDAEQYATVETIVAGPFVYRKTAAEAETSRFAKGPFTSAEGAWSSATVNRVELWMGNILRVFSATRLHSFAVWYGCDGKGASLSGGSHTQGKVEEIVVMGQVIRPGTAPMTIPLPMGYTVQVNRQQSFPFGVVRAALQLENPQGKPIATLAEASAGCFAATPLPGD